MEVMGFIVLWLVLILFGWTSAKRGTVLVLKLLPLLRIVRRWLKERERHRQSKSGLYVNIEYINITVPLEGDEGDVDR
jgi:hypothetical protein